MIRPFILSQVGEKQNELIFSPDQINLLELSEIIYVFFDKLRKKRSFFRCVKCKNQIIAAYYWKSCVPEPNSGRLGLYVVIGFIIPSKEFNFDYFWRFSSAFFRMFEDHFSVNLKCNISDRFFLQIQNNTTEKMEMFLKKYIFLLDVCFEAQHVQKLSKLHMSYGISDHTSALIYMMNFGRSFYDDWAAFIYESFLIMNNKKEVDISTLKGYTSASLQILQNGKKIYNTHISKIKVSNNPVCRYLVIYLQS